MTLQEQINTASSGATITLPDGLEHVLVFRPTLNKTRTVRFLSVRKWPGVGRKCAIKTFKGWKGRGERSVIAQAAQEIASLVQPWISMSPDLTVVAPPAGASTSNGGSAHFATEIAFAIAGVIGSKARVLFRPRTGRESSYPRPDEERGEMGIVGEVSGNYLLVDDVASSGATIERAIHSLIDAGANCVIPVAWVYETAGGTSKKRNGLTKSLSVANGILSASAPLLARESDEMVTVLSDEEIASIIGFDHVDAVAAVAQ